LRQLDGILKRQQGRGLDAAFGVHMPGNYILMYESPQGEKQQEILAKADDELAGIAGEVSRCGRPPMPSSLIPRILMILIYPWLRSHVHDDDRKFTVADTCTSCGTCSAICPAQNIELRDGRPVFLHRCELCCGCIHTCPVQAIDAGKKTKGRKRYRNPEVKTDDLKIPRGNQPAEQI
ncbi:EFR1 family ferrodoxin, partial [Methanoregula sp.]|uniref:EFR1 family ferrodoxin n=1 Tax=Methanoregula sp. TaxID=2052170 RepID=UPI000CABA127